MPHIFFQKLEKRHSTQSLLPFNSLPNLEDLDQRVGLSLQDSIRNSDFYLPSFGSSFGIGAPYGYSPSPWASNWTSNWGQPSLWASQWSSPWASNSGWSVPWSSPWASNSGWSSPWSSPWASNSGWSSPWASSPAWGSATASNSGWSSPWASSPAWGSATASNSGWSSPWASPWPSSVGYQSSAYPPGTRYGLIKRSNLKKA